MNLAGIFPPIATPFDDRDVVNPAAIRTNVARWLDAGVRGIVALGSNGEAPLLDEGEADAVIAAARESVPPDRILIAGTGRESTRATIDASRRAAALGVDAVLVRTPSYFKSRMTPDAFVAHYTALADAVDVPILLYNYPAVTGLTLTAETVARLSAHPNIVGIKETSTDAAQLAAYVDASRGEQFTVLAGSAPAFYAGLCVGASGAILAAACVAPRACVALLDAFQRGAHHEARELQRRLVPIAHAVTTGFGVPGLKAALDRTGFIGGSPRAPLQPATRDAIAALESALVPIREFL
ncbi:MAG: dihydrodipicolinate synthase family protein [Acidobacteria bacterium]|nr:dihydrodipicolinate synthase family protein [Acidobacteriota bacterium]